MVSVWKIKAPNRFWRRLGSEGQYGYQCGAVALAERPSHPYGAFVVALAPLVMGVALAYHPFIQVLLDEEAVAASVAPAVTRWGIVHMTVGVASGLLLLAFLAIHRYFSVAGENRFSVRGMPFIAMGSVLFAVLPGMEFTVLAAAETGGDVAAAQAALRPWFVSTFAIGSVIFAVGIYLFGRAIVFSGILSRGSTWLVVGGLAVLAVARFVPLGVVQFYVQAVAGIVALWPLAYAMRQTTPRKGSRVVQGGA